MSYRPFGAEQNGFSCSSLYGMHTRRAFWELFPDIQQARMFAGRFQIVRATENIFYQQMDCFKLLTLCCVYINHYIKYFSTFYFFKGLESGKM